MLSLDKQGTRLWKSTPGLLAVVFFLIAVELIPSCTVSDSRSGQVIDDRIRPTLESGSAVGSKKPVCVVIDEIDGATGAGDNVG